MSLTWLLGFMVGLFESLPDDLNFQYIGAGKDIILMKFESEIDEMWSFVSKKTNKQWIWIALDSKTRQIIAFYVGDRIKTALANYGIGFQKYIKNMAFSTLINIKVTKDIIPKNQHKPVSKDSRKTNHIERFNCTLRQRVSRLVRKALSFSKKLENHILAIKYFICHYNITKSEAMLA